MKPLRKALCLVLLLTLTTAHGVELDEIIIGTIYYHNAWNNNTRVRAVAVRGQKVEVVFLEGSHAGEVDRVYPVDLLTKTESEEEAAGDAIEGIGLGVVAVAAAVCIFSPETCASEQQTQSSSTNSYSSARSSASVRKLWMRNTCHRPVKLALTYKNSRSQWNTIAWWDIQAGSSNYLRISEAGSTSELTLSSESLYFYAEIPGTSYAWSGNDWSTSLDGRTVGMKMVSLPIDSGGDYVHELSCGNVN